MRNLVIMPAMAQRRESLNMGEFAEEAIIVEEVTAPKKVNHFIEANTQEVTLQHLQQDCIIPSFASMEETISHQSFIGAVVDAAKDYFHGEQFDMPEIRISHPINGRIPSALGKKASELTDEEKTLFYQRMCFCIIRKTKCFDFWERNVLFPKTKRSFFRTPTPSTLPFSA